jgi:hypothetical protein
MRLQRWFRAKILKWRTTFRPALDRWKAALFVQRWFRYDQLRRKWLKLTQLRTRAALVIQRVAR